MTNNLKTVIETRIEALKASETVTKAELGAVSRDLLIYVPTSGDIGMVNRLNAVLSPMNNKTSVLFFRHFLPWKFDTEASMFTTKEKGQTKVTNKLLAIEAFLKEEANSIWTWADENIELKDRAKNYEAQITSLIDRAMKDKKYGIGVDKVFNAVLAGGVPFEDLLGMVNTAFELRAAEQAKANAANDANAEEKAKAAAE